MIELDRRAAPKDQIERDYKMAEAELACALIDAVEIMRRTRELAALLNKN